MIEHRSYESWADCRDKLVRYAAAGAESAAQRGRRAGPLDVLLRPPLRFLRMYVLQLGFLDGAHGAVLCAARRGPGVAEVRRALGRIRARARRRKRAPMTVCFFGAYDPEYPRNRILRDGL